MQYLSLRVISEPLIYYSIKIHIYAWNVMKGNTTQQKTRPWVSVLTRGAAPLPRVTALVSSAPCVGALMRRHRTISKTCTIRHHNITRKHTRSDMHRHKWNIQLRSALLYIQKHWSSNKYVCETTKLCCWVIIRNWCGRYGLGNETVRESEQERDRERETICLRCDKYLGSFLILSINIVH